MNDSLHIQNSENVKTHGDVLSCQVWNLNLSYQDMDTDLPDF
jgi:hypothetical protein